VEQLSAEHDDVHDMIAALEAKALLDVGGALAPVQNTPLKVPNSTEESCSQEPQALVRH